jgi:heptose I phosphotransferase
LTVLELSPHIKKFAPANNTFDWILSLQGQIYREVKHRKTLQFELEGRRYFIKIHQGCGWKEIIKDLLQGRKPILSARTEWEAIQKLEHLGIRTMAIAGRGLRGSNPARLQSFLITEMLEGMVSLETLLQQWSTLPLVQRSTLRRVLVKKVAQIARKLHEAGMNHRDFYVCHFLVRDRNWLHWEPSDDLDLYLIDLHRVQCRSSVPHRWIVKDLGGLLFSALDAPLSRRDLLTFLCIYKGKEARESLHRERSLWDDVLQNARRLYLDFHGKEPSERQLLAVA